MTQHTKHQDQDLDALLAADSTLMRCYENLPKSEPGKHLDTAILGRATNAVRSQSTARSPWLLPIASAASVVVAASIGWRVHMANQAEPAVARNGTTSAPHEVMEIDLYPPIDKEQALEMARLPPEAPEKPVSLPKTPKVKTEQQRSTLDEIIASPMQDNSITIESHPVLHTRPAASDSPSYREQDQQAANADHEESFPKKGATRGKAEASAPVQAFGRMEPETHKSRNESSPAAPPENTLEEETLDASRIGADEPNEAQPALSPADWIERIRLLVRARRIHQARVELREFRRFYPDYRLPSDLRRYAR